MSVCCAGIGWAEKTAGSRGSHALDPFESVVRLSLIDFNVLRFAASAMLANDPDAEGERGVCISTASIAAFGEQIDRSPYSASKGGIVGMTLPAARPRAVRRPRGRDRARAVRYAAPGGPPEEARRALGEQVHPHRLGRPEEYGDLAAHIVENPMLSSGIRLDGALRMPPVAPPSLVESQWHPTEIRLTASHLLR